MVVVAKQRRGHAHPGKPCAAAWTQSPILVGRGRRKSPAGGESSRASAWPGSGDSGCATARVELRQGHVALPRGGTTHISIARARPVASWAATVRARKPGGSSSSGSRHTGSPGGHAQARVAHRGRGALVAQGQHAQARQPRAAPRARARARPVGAASSPTNSSTSPGRRSAPARLSNRRGR